MSKHYLVSLAIGALMLIPGLAAAQGMMGGNSTPETASSQVVADVAKEEAEGKDLWTKLQDKTVTCDKLTEGDFDLLGEYFLGLMMGSATHATMNTTMTSRMGETAESQMHVTMGQRFSGCEPNAVVSTEAQQGFGILAQMMSGGSLSSNTDASSWSTMMNGTNGTGLMTYSWFISILVVVLVLLGIVALWKFIRHKE